jgi:hypothetical protein
MTPLSAPRAFVPASKWLMVSFVESLAPLNLTTRIIDAGPRLPGRP